ncbi:ribonuclease H-like domain-containing protein [Haloferula rosea]|uniref:Ribonuclease H-like domain-containing protein n=1 Tax=Haloferula rosea TaxID=490093 RepID=A0A934VC86_9BACT|nr:ribonuclease H-like domain-containing protein [Haloferula rosea]MBK1828183.1 ribonuclease H-like domain-containing protein [Haloferula rosea]
MAEKNIVYFDLETQRSFSDVGGSAHKDKMMMSVGVTYSTANESYRVYGEDEVDELVKELLKADLVVGWNHVEFDYPVLQGYTVFDLPNQTLNLDMMLALQEILGFRLKLDAAAAGSLGMGKTADGLDALKWWQEHKKTGNIEPLMKIAEYCAFDVKVTKCVHEYAVEHGHLKYHDRGGQLQEVEVDWK